MTAALALMAMEILSLRGMKQSVQKIASCLAKTDCNVQQEIASENYIPRINFAIVK
jgi:hypothetical protein